MEERKEKKLFQRNEGRKAKRAELEAIITSQKKKKKMEEKIAEKD